MKPQPGWWVGVKLIVAFLLMLTGGVVTTIAWILVILPHCVWLLLQHLWRRWRADR